MEESDDRMGSVVDEGRNDGADCRSADAANTGADIIAPLGEISGLCEHGNSRSLFRSSRVADPPGSALQTKEIRSGRRITQIAADCNGKSRLRLLHQAL